VDPSPVEVGTSVGRCSGVFGRLGVGAAVTDGGGGAAWAGSSMAPPLEASARASESKRSGAERCGAVVSGERLRALLKPSSVGTWERWFETEHARGRRS
jgi:hypothetical protein